MERKKLFCEISPLTYAISTWKCRALREVSDVFSSEKFAKTKEQAKLPILIYKHKSLIRRKLGTVDHNLQNNKAVNLSLAAPKVSGILIKPGETFSFWRLVGDCTAKKGYKEGLTISSGAVNQGIGGGMCQFTNLIHWMVLHTPLTITEYHHHDGVDLFPDFGRQIPFGTGTSIMYNYLDYRFQNNTDLTFQLVVYLTEEYLCGELRADKRLEVNYHIKAEQEHFSREGDTVYRNNVIYRECVDSKTGIVQHRELIKKNHAKVLYDTSGLSVTE